MIRIRQSHWYTLCLFFFLCFPFLSAHAANIGFASSGVSFATDTPFAGIPTKVYTVVINNQYKKMTATISFIDNGQEFARITTVIDFEEAQQVSAPWTPTTGPHTVGARFISAVATDAQGNTRQLKTAELDAIASPVSQSTTIDNDSDHDGIGDHEEMGTYHTSPLKFDSDDDGLSDYEEIFTYKTDPNNPNTDGDSMKDGAEIHAGRNPLISDDPAPPPPPVSAPTAPSASSKSLTTVAPTQKSSPTAPSSPVKKTNAAQPTLTTTETGSNTKKVQAKKPVAAPKIISAIADPQTAPATDSSTTPETTTNTTTDSIAAPPRQPRATPPEENQTGNWVTVLGVLAGLFGVTAAVTGGLAWREKNRYY